MIVFQRFLVRRSGKEGDVGRLSVWSEMGCVNTAGNDSVAVAKKNGEHDGRDRTLPVKAGAMSSRQPV